MRLAEGGRTVKEISCFVFAECLQRHACTSAVGEAEKYLTARKANVSGKYTDGLWPNLLRPWGLERAAGHGDFGKPLPDVLCEKHRQQLFDQKTTFL